MCNEQNYIISLPSTSDVRFCVSVAPLHLANAVRLFRYSSIAAIDNNSSITHPTPIEAP